MSVGWAQPGMPEYDRVMVVVSQLECAAAQVDYDPAAIAGGFIQFMAPCWAHLSDVDFESDVAELVNGLRLTRANFQSQGKVKS